MSTGTSCHSKQISFMSDFIQFFYDFIHIYSLGAGKAPRGQSFDVNFIHLLQVKKKMSLKSDFIHFFSRFNTCI